MNESSPRLSQADAHLLKQVSTGDQDGWRALVNRFQARLTAFAQKSISGSAGMTSADDLVQETFVSFLKSAQTFRADCSLETFLFRIMRYRINDHFRKASGVIESRWSPFDSVESSGISGNTRTASSHARRAEQLQQDQQRLSAAIFRLTGELKECTRFRDLKIAEGLFFAGLRNRELAATMSVTENEVAVVKHRLLARLRALLGEPDSKQGDAELAADFSSEGTDRLLPDLEQIWLDQRPSCPKRTTLGKYALEILPEDWTDFVHFHVELLGCGFCQANLVELQCTEEESSDINEVLFQSTIGFLPPSR